MIICSLRMCVRAHSRLTLWHPMDCSLPGSSVQGIFQARVLEWVAISFLNLCLWHLLHWQEDSLPTVPLGKYLSIIQYLMYNHIFHFSKNFMYFSLIFYFSVCLFLLLYKICIYTSVSSLKISLLWFLKNSAFLFFLLQGPYSPVIFRGH